MYCCKALSGNVPASILMQASQVDLKKYKKTSLLWAFAVSRALLSVFPHKISSGISFVPLIYLILLTLYM
jgi:uncharacterized membrane protein (UPF0136 family)